MAVRLKKRPLTTEQFERMIHAGILAEADRLELLDGEIVEMAPIGHRHAWYVNRVADLLYQLAGAEFLVSVQNPVELNATTRPQPDVALVRRRPDVYPHRLPRPEDIVLVVEVADTTAESDRVVNIPLYARAGIPEAWLLDIETDHVDVFRAPGPDAYREVRSVGPGEELSVLALPGLSFAARRIVGAATT